MAQEWFTYAKQHRIFFTARRFASAVLATAIPSVCPSVTCRYCVKTTAHSTVPSFVETKQIFPRDDHFPLKSWLQVTYPLLIAASLDTFRLVAPQR